MDICIGGCVGFGDCIVDGIISVLEGSDEESGGGIEVRIKCLNQDLQDGRMNRI